MSIFDWIKEIPLSALYRERLDDAYRQIADLKAQLADLTAQVAHLQLEKIDCQARLEKCEQERWALNETIIKQLSDSHDNGLIFCTETGTWIDPSSTLRYCAKCKASGVLSPMTKSEHGWKCPVCDAYAADPKRPEPPFRRLPR